jgi:diacylglycerol kinase family enzyme
MMKRRQETFDMEIDDNIILKDITTQFILVFNSKFGGGRMILNPLAIINDGYFEFYYFKTLMGFSECIKLFDGAKAGGTQVYNADAAIYRCKKLKLINKKTNQQDVAIDGEDLVFDKFVIYEQLKQELEIIVDFQYMMEKSY